MEELLSLERVRFEVIPVTSSDGKALLPRNISILPKNAWVTVTCSEASGGIDATIRTAKRLKEKGVVPVAHIPGRIVRDASHLRAIAGQLQDADIGDIFVIGGDMTPPVGKFSSALELLEELRALPVGFRSIGVAAYPQGHPHISEQTLTEALAAKQAYADHAVTQICGSARALCRWMERIREQGITLPVYAGVIGCVGTKRLLRIAGNFRVRNILWFALRNPHVAASSLATGGYTPHRVIKGLAGSGDLAGVHFNTFNCVEATEMWRRRFVP